MSANQNENMYKEKYHRLLDEKNQLINEKAKAVDDAFLANQKYNQIKNSKQYLVGQEIIDSFRKPGLKTLSLPKNLKRVMKSTSPQNNKIVIKSNNNILSKAKKEEVIDVIKKVKLPEIELPKSYPSIMVATIFDDFSYQCFKHECELVQLHSEKWMAQLKETKPDFLFAESAWRGLENSWTARLTSIKDKPNSPIYKLLEYCKQNNIPTVFWNKEDPPNYHLFIDTAKLFDYVFTTEENVVEQYKKDLTHDRIFVLPFAAQPAIHNPISISQKNYNVAFAGSWYTNKHSDRNKDTELLLDAAIEHDVHIYDRFFDLKNREKYMFPSKFEQNILGALSYEDILKAYKLYKIFLNVNTVTNSSTMFSRRVYELLAVGTNVLSTDSKGIKEHFGSIVPICKTKEDVKNQLDFLLKNDVFRERLSILGVREVFSKHLYQHRFQKILNVIGLKVKNNEQDDSGFTIITCTNRTDFLNNILSNFNQQIVKKKELIIVINNDQINKEEWRQKVQEYPNIKILQLSEDKTLGECLNTAVKESNYHYIAKFDDDDYYGPSYLLDTYHAYQYTDADIIGKQTYFAFIEELGAISIRKEGHENRFTNFVHGGTITFRKSIFEHVQFQNRNRGEDTSFLREADRLGFKIYSTNKYNFSYLKSSNKKHHTWNIELSEFLKDSKILAFSSEYKSHVTI
ncbi:glycosyltransferase family protein [Metabacillus halosaccharovorans]|uniref:glycosyltransferase family protein n=1 Tax=Metabacillus halosaccharovorans TaxID=930124 RepID=UPI00203A91E4|nr:glycosyltransferase [Metabacillus halosaccharovorans]MCM3443786.1 glycosyltransferase [Metabacillus halosaccharovorans]